MRAALVEFASCHGETLASMAAALVANGVAVDLIAHPDLIAQRPLEPAGLRPVRVGSTTSLRARFDRLVTRMRRYDLVLVNTVEPSVVLRGIARFHPPVLAVVHSGVVVAEDPEYQAFFAAAHRAAIVLSPHVAASLPPDCPHEVVRPALATHPRGARRAPPEPPLFCVPGTVELARRDYLALLDACQELERQEVEEFEVVLCGRDRTADALRVRREIGRRGLQDRVRFTGALDFPGLYAEVARATCLLPLIHADQSSCRPYFEDRSSGSLWLAVGCGVPLLAEAGLTARYGLEVAAREYPPGGLARAMRDVAADPGRVAGTAAALESVRSKLLEENAAAMGRLLRRVRVAS